jgi:hypothetical protein
MVMSRRVYNDFHRHEKTGSRFPIVPVEDAAVFHLHTRVCSAQFFLLQFYEVLAYLDDDVTRAIINRGMIIAEVVENVHCQSAISRSDFIDVEIFVRKVFKQIL